MTQEVDLEKLQRQYELIAEQLGRLGGELEDARGRVSEIAEIRRALSSPDQGLEEYHRRTIDLLKSALDRYGEMYDLMLQSGTDAIKTMGRI